MYCPVSAAIRPAKYSRQSAPDAASATSVSCNGLPVSSDSSTDSSRLRSRMASAARCRTRPRSTGGVRDQAFESAPGCVHRLFDHRRVGSAQTGDDRPIGGVDALELRAITVDELAVDEVATKRLSAHRIKRSCRAQSAGSAGGNAD